MLDAMYTVVLQKRFYQQAFGVYIGKNIPSGLYVVTVEPNSPAAEANIQPGDRVVAVNGQSVSSISTDPTDMVLRVSNEAETLTLSLLPSDVLKLAGINPTNHHNGYTLQENTYFNPLLWSNQNDYNFTSGTYGLRSRPHHHRRRKRRALKSTETQTPLIDNQQENNQELSPRRSIPSMGTPHVFLRNAQSNSKDTGHNDIPEDKPVPNLAPPIDNSAPINRSPEPTTPPTNTSGWSSYTPEFSSTPQPPPQLPNIQANPRSIPEIASRSSPSPSPSVHDDGFRVVVLRRTPDFLGYGFHLQYNRVYYIIHHIESNSPAERSGLRPRDVIRRVNNQSTDQMPHQTFVQIVNDDNEITLLVQPYDNFIRANPNALRAPRKNPVTNASDRNEDQQSKNPLSRAFSKLKSR